MASENNNNANVRISWQLHGLYCRTFDIVFFISFSSLSRTFISDLLHARATHLVRVFVLSLNCGWSFREECRLGIMKLLRDFMNEISASFSNCMDNNMWVIFYFCDQIVFQCYTDFFIVIIKETSMRGQAESFLL